MSFFKCSQGTLLYIVLIIIVCFLVFGRTISFGFVWDDQGFHLLQNQYLEKPSLQSLTHFWTHTYQGMYIPVSYTFIMLITLFSKATTLLPFNQAIFHFFNILFHCLNCILLFLFLRRIFHKDFPACIGVLLYMVHPVQVEVVAMVTEFRGLLATFWGFIFLLTYDSWLHKSKNKRFNFALCLLLFMLSVLSKPIGIVFFPIALFYSRLITKTHSKKILSLHILLLIISLIAVFLTTLSQPTFVLRYNTPFFGRFFVWMDAINFYLLKILLPLRLSPSYARTPKIVLSQWHSLFTWLIPMGIFILLYIKRRKFPLALFAFLVFIFGFLPVSGLVSFIFQNWSTVADRYLYIPMLGIALIVGYVVSSLSNKLLLFSFLFLILILGLTSALVHVPVWESNISLWSHCMEVTPQEANAYYNRGNEYLRNKEYELANKDFEQAISLDSSFHKALYKKGFLLLGQKKFDEAIEYFDAILSLDPEFAIAYTAKAVAYFYKKEYDKAWLEIENARRRGVQVNTHFIKKLKVASGKGEQ